MNISRPLNFGTIVKVENFPEDKQFGAFSRLIASGLGKTVRSNTQNMTITVIDNIQDTKGDELTVTFDCKTIKKAETLKVLADKLLVLVKHTILARNSNCNR